MAALHGIDQPLSDRARVVGWLSPGYYIQRTRDGRKLRCSTWQKLRRRTADGVRGGAPREIFALFASK